MNSQPEPTIVYTLGHGDREVADFLDCLASFGISTAVDVRSWPVSRRHPEYDRERLEAVLSGAGRTYRWLGAQLGGFRPEGYEAHMRTEAFGEGVRRLAALAREGPLAIFCAELDPARCHRRFISRALAAEGVRVLHIEAPGRLFSAAADSGQGTLFPIE